MTGRPVSDGVTVVPYKHMKFKFCVISGFTRKRLCIVKV